MVFWASGVVPDGRCGQNDLHRPSRPPASMTRAPSGPCYFLILAWNGNPTLLNNKSPLGRSPMIAYMPLPRLDFPKIVYFIHPVQPIQAGDFPAVCCSHRRRCGEVNYSGGAIALGLLLGSTGDKLFVTSLNELDRVRGRYVANRL